MLAQSFRRSLLETRGVLPPTFLLPFSARLSTVPSAAEQSSIPESLVNSKTNTSLPTKDSRTTSRITSPPIQSTLKSPNPAITQPPPFPTPLPETVKTLLPLLSSQPPYYLTAHIHGRPYLLTAGDTLRLPFRMSNVQPGDTLRLNRATHIGSRDYTLSAPAAIKGTRDGPKKTFYLDERLFICRATVLGTESEPMRVKEKTKRRMRHIRKVKSKHRFTVLRITELDVKSVGDVEGKE
ncbi:hypothetical protein AOQ84DRAFT_204449 [Glonium stellatum]|uniref:Large ribosomal subunit protein bL21m n=1 Tax=Glonium stellatum TaxID=574774 RepID=A0A8E2JM63_9PEZI|nr:hypothetical protein AOQ84DRAFT_204449 [Glonium stellatum]